MHFYYIDEAGCTGEDLQNNQQPVFVAGGIIVRDEGWNKTKDSFDTLVSEYFEGHIPGGFEVHAHQLLSPLGAGPFEGHDRDRRIALADRILDLVAARSHHVGYIAIDKRRLHEMIRSELPTKMYLPRRAPYTIAYDYLVSIYEYYTREKLGQSARGLVIVDSKEGFQPDIARITQHRRIEAPRAQRVKWLTEFTYAIESRQNPMIQMSDLVCFVSKKYLEVSAGYNDGWTPEAKAAYRDLYAKVHDRLIRRGLLPEEGRHSDLYNQFMESVTLWPARNFKRIVY